MIIGKTVVAAAAVVVVIIVTIHNDDNSIVPKNGRAWAERAVILGGEAPCQGQVRGLY